MSDFITPEDGKLKLLKNLSDLKLSLSINSTIDSVVDVLIENEIFPWDSKDELDSIQSAAKRVDYILKVIFNNGVKGYRVFLKCLRKNGLATLAAKIEDTQNVSETAEHVGADSSTQETLQDKCYTPASACSNEMDAMSISGDASPVDVSCERDRLSKQNTFIIYRQTSSSLQEEISQLDLVALLKEEVTMCIDEKVKQEVEETVKQKVDTVRQELESTVAKLQNENKEADADESNKLLNEINDQKEKLNELINEHNDKTLDMQTQIDTLQHDAEKTNAELVKYRNEVQRSTRKIKELRDNCRQLEIHLSEEKKDKKKLKSNLEWYKNKNESLAKENESLNAMLQRSLRQNGKMASYGCPQSPLKKNSYERGFPKINTKR